ncbi:MAG: tetratricopeptide repeat protein [Aliidongia sp.]
MRSAFLTAILLVVTGCGDAAPDPAEMAKLAYRHGIEAIEAHDFAAAERYLVEAAGQEPDDPYILLNLGVAYQNLGKLDEARAAYRHAAETGEHLKPVRVTDPHYAGRSIADLARDNLASLPP